MACFFGVGLCMIVSHMYAGNETKWVICSNSIGKQIEGEQSKMFETSPKTERDEMRAYYKRLRVETD